MAGGGFGAVHHHPRSLGAFPDRRYGALHPGGGAEGRDIREPDEVGPAVVLRLLRGIGVSQGDPARLIRSSQARAKEPSTLEPGEIERIRAVLGEKKGTLADRNRLIFELLLGTGIRLGSLVGLNVGDVDLEACTIHIQAKGGGRERVFLNPQLCGMLRQHLGESAIRGACGPAPASGTCDTPVFRSKSGRRLGARQIQLNFARGLNQAGINRPFSIHSLRHTFATRLYRKTGDLYLVQKALGHRQITTTEIYARVSDDALKQAVEAV